MNGIIIIDKPKGFTSQDVVSKVKKILNIKKAGHIGTLDPLAEGVLPVLLGEYTKLSKYLMEHDKTYIASLKLGKRTDTGDAEGVFIEEKEVPKEFFSEEKIREILERFKGKQIQTPPIYSAIKVEGKKLYEYARKGESVEIPKREIEIFDIDLLKIDIKENEITFKVNCSKGTYIRSLCEDIAKKLNTVGYMSKLIRTVAGEFKIEEALTFDILENNKEDRIFLEKKIIKMENMFSNHPKIVLNKRKEELFLNGVMLTFELKDGIYNVYTSEHKYIGLGVVKNMLLKRDVIIKE